MTATWYRDTAYRLEAASCSFVHAGRLHRTREFQSDFLAAIELRGHSPLALSLLDLCNGDLPDLVEGRSVAVIWRPELQRDRRDFVDLLAGARPTSQRLQRSNIRVVFVSGVPRSTFPSTRGSPALGDAVRLPIRMSTAAEELALEFDLDESAVDRVLEHSHGSIALAEEYLRIELLEGESGNVRHALAEAYTAETLRGAFDEMGPRHLAQLEHYLRECNRWTYALNDIPDDLAAVLDAAGLADIAETHATITVGGAFDRGQLTSALDEALQSLVHVDQAWVDSFALLCEYERLLRLVVAMHLTGCHGANWRRVGLGRFGAACISVATLESYPPASTIEDIANPLDWLLLDQLLELAGELAAASSGFALSPRDISRIRSTLVPIRNRVMHMRLPKPEDVMLVRGELRRLNVVSGNPATTPMADW